MNKAMSSKENEDHDFNIPLHVLGSINVDEEKLFNCILQGKNWIPETEGHHLEVIQPKFDRRTTVCCDGEPVFVLDPDIYTVIITSRRATPYQHKLLTLLCKLFGWGTWAQIDYFQDSQGAVLVMRNRNRPSVNYMLDQSLKVELPNDIKRKLKDLHIPPMVLRSSGQLRRRRPRRFRPAKAGKLLKTLQKNVLYT